MKKITKMSLFLVMSAIAVVTGCKKDNLSSENAKITSYSLEIESNPALKNRVLADIEENDIFIRIPNTIDITKVIPSFEIASEKSIVYINNKVQESGVSAIDMSNTFQYRIATPNGMSFYNVTAYKNASIFSFGFYKEDNEGVIFKDYVAKVSGLNITVDLPTDADITKLVARYTTSTGAEVKVNGNVQTSKVNEQDYTNPIIFSLTDEQTSEPENFVVTVGRLTAPEWGMLRLTNIDSVNVSNLRLAINPINNLPYIVYSLSSSSAAEEVDRKAVAAYFDNNVWNFVGSRNGFSDNRVDVPSISFDSKGILYAAYKDYDATNSANTQKATIQKFENNAWNYVGERWATPTTVNYLDVAVDANDKLLIGFTAAKALNGIANRASYAMVYTGSVWTGSSVGAISSSYFSRTFRGDDGYVYYVSMDMTTGTASRRPTMYKYVNTQWTLVGTANVSPTATTYGAILVDAAVDKNGLAYLVFQSQATTNKKSFVMKFDGNSWKQIGDVISHTAGSSAERDNVALAVHPNGTLYFAYGDVSGVKVSMFNNETNNWSNEAVLTTVNGDKLDLKISNDGIPYLATTINGKIAVYKYDIPSN